MTRVAGMRGARHFVWRVMTASDFISQIFGRPGYGHASNVRALTDAQLGLMLELIGQDKDGAAVRRGAGRSVTWMPSGSWNYVITEDPLGRGKNTIKKVGDLRPSGAGSLF